MAAITEAEGVGETGDEHSSFEENIELPGYGLPLDYKPTNNKLFPNAMYPLPKASRWDSAQSLSVMPLTTLREFTMLQVMNEVTDKPNWETKVFDDSIAAKWKQEMLADNPEDEQPRVSEDMAEWIIAELRHKAEIYGSTGAISIFNGDVVKSDSAIPVSLKDELKAGVQQLETASEGYKDYHPGSDEKVLDLVHPSLFPLVYGRSRILPDRSLGLDDALRTTGMGAVISKFGFPEEQVTSYRVEEFEKKASAYSTKFQWLPCDVLFQNGETKIDSYINNLHPRWHRNLYGPIEKIIDLAIPLWNMTLSPLSTGSYTRKPRMTLGFIRYDPDPEQITDLPDHLQRLKDQTEANPSQTQFEDEYYEAFEIWSEEVRRTVQPEPDTFSPEILECEGEVVDLKKDYQKDGLQVIVKLANIELTPEKPYYEGGSWHVEGQMNEHICATALYYYNSENITPSRLDFRQESNEDTIDIGYEQGHHGWLNQVFGCEQEGEAVQNIGSVICSEGRLLTFPNILQHRVEPFGLDDETKNGHRKILALFLVDPHIRVISTANVPPQRRDWWEEILEEKDAFHKLPKELRDQVYSEVEFPISMEEAKTLREELMEERKNFVGRQSAFFTRNTFSLCEH